MGPHEVLQGLLAKRRELDEQLERIERERRATIDDIVALDRAARVFDPAYIARAARQGRKRKRRGPTIAFVRHELNTLIGQVLRNADGPVTTADVTVAVADRKQIPADDKETRSSLLTRVGVALNSLEKSKVVRGARTPGERMVRWTPARERSASA
jgi:hypothetical protein